MLYLLEKHPTLSESDVWRLAIKFQAVAASEDDDDFVWLSKTAGYCKNGQRKYIALTIDMEKEERKRLFIVKAFDDDEAVSLANAKLAKRRK
jgi:hypothetical protein